MPLISGVPDIAAGIIVRENNARAPEFVPTFKRYLPSRDSKLMTFAPSSQSYYALNVTAFSKLCQSFWAMDNASIAKDERLSRSHFVDWFIPSEFHNMNECMDYVFDMLHKHQQEIQQGKKLGAVVSMRLPEKLAIIGKDDVVYAGEQASDVYLWQTCLFAKTGLQQTNFARKTNRVGLAFQDTDRRLWSTKHHSEILVTSGKHQQARRGQKYMLSRNACKMVAVRMQHELLEPELRDGCRMALHIADTQHSLDAAVDKVAQALKALKPQEKLRPATQTAISTLMHDVGEMILQPALQRTARMLREARKQQETWEEAVFNYSNEEYVHRFIDPAVRSLCHGAAVRRARETDGDFEARVMQTTAAVNDTLLQGLEVQTVITPRGELIALEVHRLTGSLKTLFILKGAGIGISPDVWSKSCKDWRKVALPAITPRHNIHIFIDNCGIYHKHTARSNLDTILKPRLHTAVFVIITLQENGGDSPQMKPLDSFVANPSATVPENLIPEARGPKWDEMLQNYVYTCKVNVLRTGLFDDVARQQSESWRNMKYCPAEDCKDEKTYPKSKRTCDTCSGSLASCEELMEIVANADKELQPERSHGDDEGSDADDISLQTIDSDSDDSAYEETDDEAVVAHSEEKERAGPTTQTSGALGISAAPSVDEGIIQSSSTSSTMQDESGHPRRIPRIATMPMYHGGQSQANTEEVLEEITPWLCPDNGPRQWIDITGDLVTLAYVDKLRELCEEYKRKLNLIAGPLHEHIHNLKMVMTTLLPILGHTPFRRVHWGSPKQIELLAKCQDNRKVRDVLMSIVAGFNEERIRCHLLQSEKCASCTPALQVLQRTCENRQKEAQEQHTRQLQERIRQTKGSSVDLESKQHPTTTDYSSGVVYQLRHLWRKHLEADDLQKELLRQQLETTLGALAQDRPLPMEQMRVIGEFFDDDATCATYSEVEDARAVVQLLLCGCSQVQKVREYGKNDPTMSVVCSIMDDAFAALQFHTIGVRKHQPVVMKEARDALMPLKFVHPCKLYDRMPLADAVRRRWTMNDEYQTYMYEHEVAASVFDFLGLDEWGEIFIRRVKRAIGHADTSESWDRANYLANHWESIQRSVDKSLRLPRRKARQRTELDRRKDINAIRQVFRESDYLIPNSQRGLKTLDDTNMPPDVQRIRQVGQELIRRFLRDVVKSGKSLYDKFEKEELNIGHANKKRLTSEAKLATFKFEEVVYEASALQKLTVVILKAIAERLGITLKTAKNKQEWITRIIARAGVNERPQVEDVTSASEHPQFVSTAAASANERPHGQAERQEERPRIRQRQMEENENVAEDTDGQEESCSAARNKRRKNEQLVVCWCNEIREQEPTIECAAGKSCICGGRVHRRCAGRHDFERYTQEQKSYLCKHARLKKRASQ